MAKPDDSSLDPDQLRAVEQRARDLLNRASVWDRYPTPIDDILAAAKLKVESRNAFDPAGLISYIAGKTKQASDLLKSALSKVFGIYDAGESTIHIDDTVARSKQTFLKLHETGHHELPTHRKLFRLFQDCEQRHRYRADGSLHRDGLLIFLSWTTEITNMADITITAANVARGSDALVDHGTAGVAITAGQTIYLDSVTSKMVLSDNNGAGTRTVNGVALHAAAANQPIAFQKSGDITIGATLTAGQDYWLSATPGGIAPRADLTTGMDPILIGVAKSATVLTLAILDVGVTL